MRRRKDLAVGDYVLLQPLQSEPFSLGLVRFLYKLPDETSAVRIGLYERCYEHEGDCYTGCYTSTGPGRSRSSSTLPLLSTADLCKIRMCHAHDHDPVSRIPHMRISEANDGLAILKHRVSGFKARQEQHVAGITRMRVHQVVKPFPLAVVAPPPPVSPLAAVVPPPPLATAAPPLLDFVASTTLIVRFNARQQQAAAVSPPQLGAVDPPLAAVTSPPIAAADIFRPELRELTDSGTKRSLRRFLEEENSARVRRRHF